MYDETISQILVTDAGEYSITTAPTGREGRFQLLSLTDVLSLSAPQLSPSLLMCLCMLACWYVPKDMTGPSKAAVESSIEKLLGINCSC